MLIHQQELGTQRLLAPWKEVGSYLAKLTCLKHLGEPFKDSQFSLNTFLEILILIYIHRYAHICTYTHTDSNRELPLAWRCTHIPVLEQWSQFLLPTKAVNLRSSSTVLQLCLGTRLGSTFSLDYLWVHAQ